MDRQASALGAHETPASAQLSPSREAPPAEVAASAARLVLDTNALLDWWLFEEAAFSGLPQALADGRVRWIACPAMRTELQRVLGRASLARYEPDCERTLAHFDQWAQLCTDPTPSPAPRLRCRDGDDQVFLDLALRESAGWLLTRDRDLLSLARKARWLGLRIATPEIWREAFDGLPA